MHSTKLRGTDFQLRYHGREITHADFFSDVGKNDRLGVLAPDRFEGAGAATLILAYVTAFYDRYRADGKEFFAYPDFFTFQRQRPVANYGRLDIWPGHKNVLVSESAGETAAAITDRGVNVLLVPDDDPCAVEIAPVELESARRNIRRCFAYSATGTTVSPDLVVECQSHLLRDYALAVIDSVPADDSVQEQRERWLAQTATDTLSQSFRELELSEALGRI